MNIRRRTAHMLWLMGAVLAVFLAACSSPDRDSDDTSAGDSGSEAAAIEATDDAEMDDDSMDAEAPAEAEEAADDGSGLATSTPVGETTPAELGRQLIFTAEIAVLVDDLDVATRAAAAALEPFGGLVFGQQTTSEPTPRSTIEFKVRPEDFGAALDALSDLGDVQSQVVTTDDVTERLVDLGSRIAALEVSIARLQDFLAAAESIETIAALERELVDRETTLEVLRGQQRTIQGRVDLATITITLTERVLAPSLTLTQTAYRGADSGAGCPGVEWLDLPEPDTATLCFAVLNDGDVTLEEVTVVDESSRRGELEIVLLRGSTTLEPGATATFYAEIELDDDFAIAAAARAVTAEGVPVAGRASELFIDVEPSTDLPGFTDAIGAGIGILLTIGSVLLIVAGGLIPFLAVALVLFVPVRWLVRRIRRSRAARSADSDTPPPPPAPPQAAS